MKSLKQTDKKTRAKPQIRACNSDYCKKSDRTFVIVGFENIAQVLKQAKTQKSDLKPKCFFLKSHRWIQEFVLPLSHIGNRTRSWRVGIAAVWITFETDRQHEFLNPWVRLLICFCLELDFENSSVCRYLIGSSIVYDSGLTNYGVKSCFFLFILS